MAILAVSLALTSGPLLPKAFAGSEPSAGFWFTMQGRSMEPTLHNNEQVWVNTAAYRHHLPRRGDIVLFRAVPAGQPDLYFIKRIVGLPRDMVRVTNGSVYINGRRLPETSYQHTIPDYNWGPDRVPPSDYFVLGDNRNNSEDSHLWKWLPRSDIIGRVSIRIR
jgi:signal peptidase I